jgi:hypothetical protein
MLFSQVHLHVDDHWFGYITKLEKQNPVTDLLGRVGIAYQP